MLIDAIVNNWDTSAYGYAAVIEELSEQGFPAWTIKTRDVYGVAIELPPGIEVSESFSGAQLYNDRVFLNDIVIENALILCTGLEEIKTAFASLCAELVAPGKDGVFRDEVTSDPVGWWLQWKELLGNRSVDDRVYDVLGELIALKYLLQDKENAVWNGPDAATYDIDCAKSFYEVKSTTARKKRQITLSNQFQLDPPDGSDLFLILCQFEPSQAGISINGLVDELIALGYSGDELERKLERLGLERRKSSRRRCYILHAMIKYRVNEDFPAIRESSFVGGTLPKGVQSLTYTLSLDGIEGEVLM